MTRKVTPYNTEEFMATQAPAPVITGATRDCVPSNMVSPPADAERVIVCDCVGSDDPLSDCVGEPLEDAEGRWLGVTDAVPVGVPEGAWLDVGDAVESCVVVEVAVGVGACEMVCDGDTVGEEDAVTLGL